MKKIKIVMFYIFGFIISFLLSNFISYNAFKNINNTNSFKIKSVKAETSNSKFKMISVPTGTIMSFMGNTVPKGYIICDGRELNITDYSNLAEYIKKEFGSYNYFGGDGTSTFKIPDLRGEYLRGTGTGKYGFSGLSVGTHQAEGLPNITGSYSNINHITRVSASGAFSVKTSYEYQGTNSGTNFRDRGPATYTFNASNSNKIYGNSTDVRPSNMSVLFIIKF